MILAFSLTLLLCQGTFAQPQLDGRYGVDRVAMEKQAKEAATNGTPSEGKVMTFPSTVERVVIVNESFKDGDVCVIRDNRCNLLQSGGAPPPDPKPSSQITAVRAVKVTDKIIVAEEKDKSYEKGFSEYCGGSLGKAKDNRLTCSYPQWACRNKSSILLHSEDGSEHWCLKIEAGR